MTVFRKFAAVALTSLTLSAAWASTAEAQYRRHGFRPAPPPVVGYRRHNGWNRGGMVAAGLLGGAMLGAAIAAPRPAYGAPVYAGEDCYREHVGYSRSGRPIYETVCE